RGRAATRPLLRVRRVLLDRGCADARLRPVARLTLDGVPAAELAARWGVPQCGLFRQLTSTLDAIHDLGAHAAPAGTTVLAEEQCEGPWQGDRLQWLAVGVGVTVRNAVPAAVARRALSLHERLPDVRRIDVLDRLVPALVRIAALEPALSERECAAFARRD